MPLTDVVVRRAESREKAYKLADGGGLYLMVLPSGAKSWRLKYRHDGKERLLTFGLYPEVKIGEARQRRDEARAALRRGIDPGAKIVATTGPTFEWVADDWLASKSGPWSKQHAADVKKSLETAAFAAFGAKPIRDVAINDVLPVIRAIEKRGAIETAHRLRQRIEAVFAHAYAMDLVKTNPAAMVKPALAARKAKGKQPALTELGAARAMLRAALAQNAQPVTREALLLSALTAVRPGEMRYADWSEFNETAAEPLWTIPAVRMKGDRDRKSGDPHLVPLAPPAVEAVRRLRALTGDKGLVFPSIRHALKPMSENAVGYLLNRAGYHGRQTAHGFRATFSTIMNDRYPDDRFVIDLMLAHKPQGVEASYNRAQHMPRRRELANIWAALILGDTP